MEKVKCVHSLVEAADRCYLQVTRIEGFPVTLKCDFLGIPGISHHKRSLILNRTVDN